MVNDNMKKIFITSYIVLINISLVLLFFLFTFFLFFIFGMDNDIWKIVFAIFDCILILISLFFSKILMKRAAEKANATIKDYLIPFALLLLVVCCFL